jgi:pyrroline-5-carboxylate reductase
MESETKVAVLGCGNIGLSIAKGLVYAKITSPEKVILTRRNEELLSEMKKEGYVVTSDNTFAVKSAQVLIVAVTPAQLNGLLDAIKDHVNEKHVLISIVSGAR